MNTRQVLAGAVSLFAMSLSGCADPPFLYGDNPSTIASTTKPPETMPTPMIKPYPSGPYGNHDGEVIMNIEAPGYRLSVENNDSSTLVWQDGEGDTKKIEFNDFYNKNDKVKCLLVSFGASWCGACQQEQQALPADVAADEAFGVINILIEGPVNGSNEVTKDDVDEWTQKFMQNYPVILGEPSMKSLWQGYGSTIGLPFNLVVRTSDMTVVGDAIQGFKADLAADAMSRCME